MTGSHEPAPARDNLSAWAASVLLYTGPVAWLIQMSAGLALTSRPCFLNGARGRAGVRGRRRVDRGAGDHARGCAGRCRRGRRIMAPLAAGAARIRWRPGRLRRGRTLPHAFSRAVGRVPRHGFHDPHADHARRLCTGAAMPRLTPLLVVTCALAACHPEPTSRTATPSLVASQCAACHTIPGVPLAQGKVGPSLAGLSSRRYIAGVLPNTPENLRRFLQHPRQIEPDGAMPDLGLTPDQAAAIADYLGER